MDIGNTLVPVTEVSTYQVFLVRMVCNQRVFRNLPRPSAILLGIPFRVTNIGREGAPVRFVRHEVDVNKLQIPVKQNLANVKNDVLDKTHFDGDLSVGIVVAGRWDWITMTAGQVSKRTALSNGI